MPNKMSSRQRMLTAIDCRQPDYTPCAFMLFMALRNACQSYAEYIKRQVEMGLDTFVDLPPPSTELNDHGDLYGLPVSYDPRVTIKEWMEDQPGERDPIMVKEYHTPAGVLRTEVRQTRDWPHGDHVPFLDDYLVPRSKKFLVTQPEDLQALRYLLVPLSEAEVTAFHAEAPTVLELARQHDLLVTSSWGVGADLIGWIHGLQNLVYSTHDQPEFVREMLDIIATWNRKRMEVVLDVGIDLYIRRAWYETCDFWTPDTYREFLLPIVKADAELAHQKGAKFANVVSSNCMPLLEMLVEADVDVLIGVDPAAWDITIAKSKVDGKVSLWGGLTGHLTVEQGTDEEVRAQVRQAMEVLAPGGGFILSPVDNVREFTPRATENVPALIDEWQRLSGQ